MHCGAIHHARSRRPGRRFWFCHIDGGHTSRETYNDLELCSRALQPGGLLALDDYFNPAFPGVCEGAIKFWLAHPGALTPVAAAFNTVLWQKAPSSLDLNAAFDERFPYIPYKTTTLWDTPIDSFSSFRAFIDTRASSPRGLLPNESFQMDAVLTFEDAEITARGGGTIQVPVRVANRSRMPFAAGAGEAPIGLSYHLLSGDGRDVRFNNARSYFWEPLAPDEERIVHMAVDVPEVQGDYEVEADIVWEGITWLKNQGLETPRLRLTVI